jgi:hypothetical protein
MLLIGEVMREKYDWVEKEMPLYLNMDNTGGHGTRDCINTYDKNLEDEHNVKVIWQEPSGPELNLADLWIWNSLQSAVKKKDIVASEGRTTLMLLSAQLNEFGQAMKPWSSRGSTRHGSRFLTSSFWTSETTDLLMCIARTCSC